MNRCLWLPSTILLLRRIVLLGFIVIILTLAPANIALSAFSSRPTDETAVRAAGIRNDLPLLSRGRGPGSVRVAESYGKLPLSFERNAGQTDSRVDFLARTSLGSIFLTQTEAVLALTESNSIAFRENPLTGTVTSRTKEGPQNRSPKSFAVTMKFAGANRNAPVEALDRLSASSNYFIGKNPDGWRGDIPNFGKVRYREIYPGIDVIYYGNQRQLEYDFIVSPRADAHVIAIGFEGAKKQSIDKNGDLLIGIPGGVIRHHKPLAYQELDGVKHEVSARYVIKSKQQVGIAVGSYDKSRTLVIDPILSYSTFLGGNGTDEGCGIAVDSLGNAYVVGLTTSSNFPTTGGSYQGTRNQFADVFVSKLNPAGSALVYSTYLGGSGVDEGYDIAVDAGGNAYIVGLTNSDDYPTTVGAFQRMRAGSGDAFVTKLNNTGSNLIYSTYVGGPGYEQPTTIAVDAQGNAHITGMITVGGFPVTPGAFQTTFRGGYQNPFQWGDAFVCKLNASGSGLIYATYLGGAEGEIGSDIAIDSEGYAYVTGGTDSRDFPITPGAFQQHFSTIFCPSRAFNCADGFVTKFNLTGTAVIYSTYVGGNFGEYTNSIAVDSSGQAIIGGSTFSTNYPTLHPLQTSFAGMLDVFVTKLNAAGSALLFSTYFGSDGFEEAERVALDSVGNVYIVGYTNATHLPVRNPIQPNLAGAYDAFVVKINTMNYTLGYCTYLGGSSYEGLINAGIAVDPAGSAYITGFTRSSNFPTTANAFQKTLSGGTSSSGEQLTDAFVAKIDDPYDTCLQDESNGNLLQINTTTGDYQFTNCLGLIVGGKGTITRRGSTVSLEHNAPDRRVMAQIDIPSGRATASMQLLSQGRTFVIADRNIANNTCVCH